MGREENYTCPNCGAVGCWIRCGVGVGYQCDSASRWEGETLVPDYQSEECKLKCLIAAVHDLVAKIVDDRKIPMALAQRWIAAEIMMRKVLRLTKPIAELVPARKEAACDDD